MNLNKLSPSELKQALAKDALKAVTIERFCEPDRLSPLNDVLTQNPDLRVVLVVDEAEKTDSDKCWNMAILPHIPAVQRLSVLSNSSEPLASIAKLNDIESLTEFSLGGFLDRKIDLAPLERHKQLESISLDLRLSKKQCRFLESMKELRSLTVESANPADLPTGSLRCLKLTKPGKTIDQIPDHFPELNELFIQKVAPSVDLGFISRLQYLEKLSINYSSGLLNLPDLSGLSQLRELELLDAKNLKSVEALGTVTSLQVLAITNANDLEVNSCAVLQKLSDLKIVYTLFANDNLEKRFAEMAKESEWVNRHPSVLNR